MTVQGKRFKYRITLVAIGAIFLTIYGLDFIVGSAHQDWSIWKWLGIGFCVGIGLIVSEGLLSLLLKPIFCSERATDPLWKRSLRLTSVVLVLSCILLAYAAIKISRS